MTYAMTEPERQLKTIITLDENVTIHLTYFYNKCILLVSIKHGHLFDTEYVPWKSHLGSFSSSLLGDDLLQKRLAISFHSCMWKMILFQEFLSKINHYCVAKSVIFFHLLKCILISNKWEYFILHILSKNWLCDFVHYHSEDAVLHIRYELSVFR